MNQPEKKRIGDRIYFTRSATSLEVSIGQKVKRWQEILIVAWIGIWLLCGFLYLSQYFISTDNQQKAFIIGFLCFWTFLLYKAIKIFIWRFMGEEQILIGKNELKYKRSFGGLGKVRSHKLSEMSDFGLIKYSEKSFKKSMESYFWNMGAETIGFKTPTARVYLGMQLNAKDAKLLSELIYSGVKKFKA